MAQFWLIVIISRVSQHPKIVPFVCKLWMGVLVTHHTAAHTLQAYIAVCLQIHC